jgi:hypothetical protein
MHKEKTDGGMLALRITSRNEDSINIEREKEKRGGRGALPAFRWWWFVFSLWWKSIAPVKIDCGCLW